MREEEEEGWRRWIAGLKKKKKSLALIYFSVTVSSLFYIPVLFSARSGLHDSGFSVVFAGRAGRTTPWTRQLQFSPS